MLVDDKQVSSASLILKKLHTQYSPTSKHDDDELNKNQTKHPPKKKKKRGAFKIKTD